MDTDVSTLTPTLFKVTLEYNSIYLVNYKKEAVSH